MCLVLSDLLFFDSASICCWLSMLAVGILLSRGQCCGCGMFDISSLFGIAFLRVWALWGADGVFCRLLDVGWLVHRTNDGKQLLAPSCDRLPAIQRRRVSVCGWSVWQVGVLT